MNEENFIKVGNILYMLSFSAIALIKQKKRALNI